MGYKLNDILILRKKKKEAEKLEPVLELDPVFQVDSVPELDPGFSIGIGSGTNKKGSESKPDLELESLFKNGSWSESSMVPTRTVRFATLHTCLLYSLPRRSPRYSISTPVQMVYDSPPPKIQKEVIHVGSPGEKVLSIVICVKNATQKKEHQLNLMDLVQPPSGPTIHITS